MPKHMSGCRPAGHMRRLPCVLPQPMAIQSWAVVAPGGQHGDPDVVVLHHRLAQLQQRRVIGQVEVKVWVLDVVERVLQRKKTPRKPHN